MPIKTVPKPETLDSLISALVATRDEGEVDDVLRAAITRLEEAFVSYTAVANSPRGAAN